MISSSLFMRSCISKSTAKLNIKWLCFLHFLHLCLEQSLLWNSLHSMVDIQIVCILIIAVLRHCVYSLIQMHYRLCLLILGDLLYKADRPIFRKTTESVWVCHLYILFSLKTTELKLHEIAMFWSISVEGWCIY